MDAGEARRRAIAAWLQEKKPELASTYRAALSLLGSPAEGGHERTRVLLICHSMREVMNRLPTAVVGGTGASVSERANKRQSASDQVQALPRLRTEFLDMDLTQEVENVPVPRAAALALSELIDAATYEDQRRVADLAAFLTDDGNPKHPAVREWRSLSRSFTKWAHLRDKPEEDLPSDEDLSRLISVFEDHVDAMRMAFFESKSLVEDVLSSANRKVGEAQP